MLVALDILCKYKNRFIKFYQLYDPILITFLTNKNLLYHIIVADEDNKNGIVKLVNAHPLSFPNKEEMENINCQIPFLYTIYPEYEIINSE